MTFRKEYSNDPFYLLSFCQWKAIMLVGLPGVGKTKWAYEYAKKNPDRSYYILGVSSIHEKMQVNIRIIY